VEIILSFLDGGKVSLREKNSIIIIMKKERLLSQNVSKTIVIYKFVSGIIELVLGLGAIIFGKKIVVFYNQFKVRELLEEPHDLLVTTITKITPFLFQHRVYIISLLLILGTVKIVGAIGLMYEKEWGLDLLIGLFIILLPFEIYGLLTGFSVANLLYFLINLLITLYLIEFKPHRYFLRLKKYFIKQNK